jgi:hypothetical protein
MKSIPRSPATADANSANGNCEVDSEKSIHARAIEEFLDTLGELRIAVEHKRNPRRGGIAAQ